MPLPQHQFWFEAVLAGDIERARLALNAGAELEARTAGGRTALMLAARHGYLQVVRELLKAGADPNATIEASRDTASDITIMDSGDGGGGPSFADLVRQRVEELKSAPPRSPAARAPERRRFEEPADAPPTGYGAYDLATPLNLALLYGHTDLALELLRAGAAAQGSDWRSTPPLALAASVGDLDAVAALLAAGASPDRGFEHAPLEAAAAHGHLEVARSLLRAGARVDAEGEDTRTALMAAAAAGQLEVVALLIEHGADPARGGADGSALVHAAGHGHAAVVAFLEPLVPGELRRPAVRIASTSDVQA